MTASPAAWTESDRRDAFERLCNDPRMTPVRQRLEKAGLGERRIEGLFKQLSRLPSRWDKYQARGGTKGVKARRAKIKTQIRKLVDLIENDPDYSCLRIYDEKRLFRDGLGMMPSKPKLSEFLLDVADFVNASPLSPVLMAIDETLSRKKNRKEFLKHAVFEHLHALIPGRTPNKESAIVVNVLLGLETDAVTASDIAMLPRKPRKSYHFE